VLLRLLAGPTALAHIRERGLSASDADVLVAPAGGTKFLLLGGLDRVLFPAIRARSRPLHCVGASIGAWRLACLASGDPEGVDRLAEAYVGESSYGARHRPRWFCDVAASLLRAALGDVPRAALVDHPIVRLHVLASGVSGLLARDDRAALVAGLALAAASNLVGRRALGRRLSRVAFHAGGDAGPLSCLSPLDDIPTRHETLTEDNVDRALLASAAIPLLVRGVEVAGRVHRDAALVDYHPVLRFDAGLILYPHFYPHLVPSWFDRALPFRRARGEVLDRTIILTPSPAYIERLPGGARPSREDARRLPNAERRRRWREVWRAGRALGDELGELLASPSRAARVAEPFFS
jgi:hypothetical protein